MVDRGTQKYELKADVMRVFSECGGALTLGEVKMRMSRRVRLPVVESVVFDLIADGRVHSLARKGRYLQRIPEIEVDEIDFVHSVHCSLKRRGTDFISVGQAFSDYIELTGDEVSFFQFRQRFLEAKTEIEASNLELEKLAFQHFGRLDADFDNCISEASFNETLITQTIDQLAGPIPEPNSSAFFRLRDALAGALNQPIRAIDLALNERFWRNACHAIDRFRGNHSSAAAKR